MRFAPTEGKPGLSLEQLVAAGEIRYVPFPDALRGKYQAYTQADRSALEQAGMTAPFRTVETGTAEYVRWLLAQGTVKAAAFLDRDGVINIDRGYVFRREDFEFVPGTLDAARELKSMGLALVVVTNQSGIARGYYGPEQFHALTDWMKETFAAHGAALDGVYFCPHHPTEGEAPYRQPCQCRKPAPGLLLDAARDLDIDLRRSVLFGDKASDLRAALAAGIPQPRPARHRRARGAGPRLSRRPRHRALPIARGRRAVGRDARAAGAIAPRAGGGMSAHGRSEALVSSAQREGAVSAARREDQ